MTRIAHAGRFARAEHPGSYAGRPGAWGEFTRALATPMEVPEAELRTLLYMSVADAARAAGAP